MAMAEELNGLSPEIRKLRKKLRQIENLEILERDLTEDEHAKILKKRDIRLNLQKLVSKRDKLQKKMANQREQEKQSLETEGVGQPSENNSVEIETEITSTTATRGNSSSKVKVSKESHGHNNKQSSASASTSGVMSDTDPLTTSHPETSSTASCTVKSSGRHDTGREARISSNEKTKRQPSSPSSLQETWKDKKFSVRTLEGHNDLICSVDCWQSIVISGSRDTMLKLWDADTGQELRSMGGHTGTVTSVRLIPYAEKVNGGEANTKRGLAVTGSKDCSIRVWALEEGQMKSSIYAYSPVECLDYDQGLIATGSEGGKVELWNLETVRSIPDEEYLATVDDESTGCVTCLACTESDKDGVTFCRWCTAGSELKVWDQLPLGKVKKRTRSEADDNGFITTKHLRRYSSPEHSDTDSSDDDTDVPNGRDSDDDDECEAVANKGSWCVIS